MDGDRGSRDSATGALLRHDVADLLDTLGEGVVVLAADGSVVAANDTARRLLAPGPELLSRPVGWLRTDGTAMPSSEQPVLRALTAGDTTSGAIVGLDHPGRPRRWLCLGVAPLETGGVVVSLRDVTRYQEGLGAAARGSQLVSTASHQVRAPLTSILGFCELLRDHWDEVRDDSRRQYVAAIDRQGRRLLRLVEELLLTSRLDAGVAAEPEDVPVEELVPEALEAVADAGQVDVTCEPGLVVRVDRDHGRQVLTNLVDNALKHGAPPVTVSAQRSRPGWVEVRVADRGDGVPEWFVPRLFDRFTRADEHGATHGSGLGLSIVRALVEANGGSVRYQPNAPTGACFVVELPAAG